MTDSQRHRIGGKGLAAPGGLCRFRRGQRAKTRTWSRRRTSPAGEGTALRAAHDLLAGLASSRCGLRGLEAGRPLPAYRALEEPARLSYPEGRVGYSDLAPRPQALSCRAGGAKSCKPLGYGEDVIDQRSDSCSSKERLKARSRGAGLGGRNLRRLSGALLSRLRQSPQRRGKVFEILRKTWAKMSPHGQSAALGLELEPESARLVQAALSSAPES